MRLRRLDVARWERIARDLRELCDEIVEDPYPDVADEDKPTSEEWPDDSPATEVWRCLTRAAALAQIHAASPSLSMAEIQAVAMGALLRLREELT